MTESKLSSKDRLLRTIAGEPVDRVPIWPPVPWHPLAPAPRPGTWQASSNYQDLVSLAEQHGDLLVGLGITERSSAPEPIGASGRPAFALFERRFFLCPPDRIDVTETTRPDGSRAMEYRIRTPKGELRGRDETRAGMDTVWQIEPLVKDTEDAERLLSVPYRFDGADLSACFAGAERLGDRGLPYVWLSSPVVMVTHVIGLQRFLEWTITERRLLDRMIQAIYERVAERLQCAVDAGAGQIYRIGGCEQATPPLMSKRLFDCFVLGYERPLWQMVRKAGKIVWVHCHGKIATVLDDFVDGGVQMLDPVEPPPQGDIEIAEAKARARRGPMTLVGNIEWNALQHREPDEIEAAVQRAICDGGHQHMILGASADAISEPDERLVRNIRRFFESGLRYGAQHFTQEKA